MKKAKKVKLTKDQQTIELMKKEILQLAKDKGDAEYQVRQSQHRETTTQQDLQTTKKKLEATQRKFELITSELIASVQTLEAAPFDQDARHLQRIIGITEGRLKAALSLTETWSAPDHYLMKGRG